MNIKKIYIYLSLLCIVAFFASCNLNQEKEIGWETSSLPENSISSYIEEDGIDENVEIPNNSNLSSNDAIENSSSILGGKIDFNGDMSNLQYVKLDDENFVYILNNGDFEIGFATVSDGEILKYNDIHFSGIFFSIDFVDTEVIVYDNKKYIALIITGIYDRGIGISNPAPGTILILIDENKDVFYNKDFTIAIENQGEFNIITTVDIMRTEEDFFNNKNWYFSSEEYNGIDWYSNPPESYAENLSNFVKKHLLEQYA